MNQEAAAERRPAPPGSRQIGLGELLGHLFKESRNLVSDYAELAVLDARRAAVTLAWLLGSVLVVAVLVVTAWMGGVAGLIIWAFNEGISWGFAIGGAALLNVIGAGVLVWWMRHLLEELPFTALLRQLRAEDPPVSEKKG
jgi:uncharacterized membrane protein YqjE